MLGVAGFPNSKDSKIPLRDKCIDIDIDLPGSKLLQKYQLL